MKWKVFEVVLEDEKWWISKDGEICKDLGSFIDPITPQIIIKEIEDG